jgi:hypothetical protein
MQSAYPISSGAIVPEFFYYKYTILTDREKNEKTAEISEKL